MPALPSLWKTHPSEKADPISFMHASALTISSRVSGLEVGNKLVEGAFSALAPQIDLYTIDTVQWVGPGNLKRNAGTELSAETLEEMLEVLFSDSETPRNIQHMLTGYIPREEQVLALCKKLQNLKSLKTILVDPVAGDHGRCYIPEAALSVIKTKLLHHAHYIFPNLTEACLYTERNPAHFLDKEPKEMAAELLEKYTNLNGVVMTSVRKSEKTTGISIITRSGEEIDLEAPFYDQLFHGTGDFFSGAVAALMIQNECRFEEACYEAFEWMKKVIEKMRSSGCNRTLSAFQNLIHQ